MDSETTEKEKEQIDLSKPEDTTAEKDPNIPPKDDTLPPRTTLPTNALPLSDQTRRRVQTEKAS